MSNQYSLFMSPYSRRSKDKNKMIEIANKRVKRLNSEQEGDKSPKKGTKAP